MKTSKLTTLILICLSPALTYGQTESFIYGKVTTVDNDVYTGALRWDDEEVYWTDMFNAAKEENENIDYLSSDELAYLEDKASNKYFSCWNTTWTWSSDNDYQHQFSCQFGEIKSLESLRGNDVLVTMQNGKKFEVEGEGYNDIGSDIKIIDSELGEISLDWDRIETVEFMSTPSGLKETFGTPLYGTVYSDQGKFTGYVQWDHDERLGTDKLDGRSEDGKVSVEFSKIASIERDGYSRSEVVLNSGRKLSLSGSNDVDNDNRGIIVAIEGVGRIDIPWKEFDKVEFSEAPKSGVKYDDFKTQKELEGTVKVTNGDSHSGKIVFDLDEAWDFEVLQGKMDDSEYVIPFRNIKKIAPRNDSSSEITLRSGDQLTLWDAQDVNEENTGVLVQVGGQRVYVPWEKVKEITFK